MDLNCPGCGSLGKAGSEVSISTTAMDAEPGLLVNFLPLRLVE